MGIPSSSNGSGANRQTLARFARSSTASVAMTSAVCAMRRIDRMGGNPYQLYQGVGKPLGLSRRGRSLPVSSMPLKGTGEARGKPPRGRAWLNNRMVNASEVGFNLRGKSPLAQNLA
jgi:hypothetical protein